MADKRGSGGRSQPSRGKPPRPKQGQPAARGKPQAERGGDDRRRAGREKRSGSKGRSGAGGPRREPERRPAPRGERGFGPYHKADDDGRDERRRRPDEELPLRRPGRPALRVVGTRAAPAESKPTRRRPAPATAPPRRKRRRGPADVEEEIRRVAGRNGDRAFRAVMAAADAYSHDREREALRILRPWRDQLSNAPSVRELVGLCHYRLGNYAAAAKELEAYAQLADSVEQNPVLMDCYRAQHKWRKVEDAWRELAEVSPSAEVMAEGRIVYAGALADQGRIDDALALLRKRVDPGRKAVRDPREHHLRLWYALADLEERAGNLARARDLFDRVRRADPQYVDVAERRAALG
jgi:tetratricopeptide (TPR) repeat protein